jgi:hypothetical protein
MPSVLPQSVVRTYARTCAAVLLSGVLTVGAASAAELPTRNVTENDKLAFQVRHLQTEVMVAALSCGRQEIQAKYNAFVTRFSGALKANGAALKTYFGRVFGAKGPSEMDSFMTRLSNELSLVSMRQSDFCERSHTLLTTALAVPPKDIEQFAQRHLTEQVAQRSGS